ncbi:hypothetical protein ACI2I2_17865 [Scandinavium sp. NPDC088450]|uniref:hypothetical protein n=1 Tax=Scandinavium sp. NPDC088450 TaxID=3364514 RepID=UPI00384AD549
MHRLMPDKIASAVGYCASGGLICWGGVARWAHEALDDIEVIGVVTHIISRTAFDELSVM